MDFESDTSSYFGGCDTTLHDEEIELSVKYPKIIDTSDVIEWINREMEQVREITMLTFTEARSLLKKFNWDSGKLLERFYEGDGSLQELLKNQWEPIPCKDVEHCGICMSDFTPSSTITPFQCNHRYCSECLSHHIAVVINDVGGLVEGAVQCPGFRCTYEIDDDIVFSLLNEPSTKNKFKQIIANNFVQNNRLIKWCPNPNCESAVCIAPERFDSCDSVKCSCGFWFCFQCHEISHDPVTCLMLVEWARIRKEEVGIKCWISKHTKPCPGCNVNIEKNGGCMHMSCTKCRHQFCWMCMRSWTGSHTCEPVKFTTDPRIEISIQRFEHYNQRHEAMKRAYILDFERYIDKTSTFEIELDAQFIKIDYVAIAVETLLQSRRVLTNSYIFSYMMTTINNQIYIFEENVIFLEQATEQLSDIIQNEVRSDNVSILKQKIVDTTKLCELRRRTLMDHIQEGNENNWWRNWPVPAEELLGNTTVFEDQ